MARSSSSSNRREAQQLLSDARAVGHVDGRAAIVIGLDRRRLGVGFGDERGRRRRRSFGSIPRRGRHRRVLQRALDVDGGGASATVPLIVPHACARQCFVAA